jgi:hypothetical protein
MQPEQINYEGSLPAPDATLAGRGSRILLEIFPRLLGLLFVYVSYKKYQTFGNMYEVLVFDGIPDKLIYPLGYSIIAAEFVLGLSLLQFAWLRKPTIIASTIMLAVYSAQIGYLVMFKSAPDCGCLGAQETYESNRHANLLSLARNVCLLIPCAWTWMQLPRSSKA